MTPAKPFLKLGERKHLLAPHRQDFAIQDQIAGQLARRIGDVEERVGDLLQITRVKRDALVYFVQLAANAVVFVFQPHGRAGGIRLPGSRVAHLGDS